MSTRLLTVIVMALIMGLVFGGLRVADAAGSSAQFGRVSQLASLGEQVTGLVQALENERDETIGTTGNLSAGSSSALTTWYSATDSVAAQVRSLAAGVDGSFPANIQASVGTVRNVLDHLGSLRSTAQASQSALAVIGDYAAPISDMIALNGLIAEGTSDSSLAKDVQTLNSLSQTKEEATQERALLFNAFTEGFLADGVLPALTTALSEELLDKAAFEGSATPAEQASFSSTVAGSDVNQAEGIEQFALDNDSVDLTGLNIDPDQASGVWYTTMSAKIGKMQAVELGIAGNIVARAKVLRAGAERSALLTAIVTSAVLLIVLVAALIVARSMVVPLRRLQAAALDIATVQLPERVRQLGEAQDPSASLEVAPIDVMSADEIGQVARAFDQVHKEAVRLAGNEVMLRGNFNAMFVNLSRRSQLLIERLARMIDSEEQHEEDPGRLSNLFAMDHLVTRMRRNSENLLLLAGQESGGKWSEPLLLADVARAATSEIEQYARVSLNIQPGVAVVGQAVSDVARLLAEIIENSTAFSPQETQVHVTAREMTSGGVLMEVTDRGVGVSESRLTEMNWRLDNPPVIDVSVSRHMGLFAVGRLAQRHGVRVRLRAGSPQGLTALIWLPDTILQRGNIRTGWQQAAGQPAAQGRKTQTAGWHDPSARPRAVTDSTLRAESSNGLAAAGTQVRNGLDTGGSNAARGGLAAEMTHAAASPASTWFSKPAAVAPQPAGQQQTDGTWAEARRHAAQIIAEPIHGDQTAAGLPKRLPQANLIPGAVGSDRQVSGQESTMAAQAWSRSSPDIARSRLGGFQSGIRRAKSQATGAGEGTL